MRKRPGPDRIASMLRDIQADLDAGLNVKQACRKASPTRLPGYGGPAQDHQKERPRLWDRDRLRELEVSHRLIEIDDMAQVGRVRIVGADRRDRSGRWIIGRSRHNGVMRTRSVGTE
jgi:hypothetical protein